MKLSIESNEQGVAHARVAGKITQSHVSPFAEPLGDALGPHAYEHRVLLDLSGVEVLDSSGVSWLLSCHKRFREGGGTLVLHSMSEIALNVIKVLNLKAVFRIAGNAGEAAEMVAGDGS